MKSYENEIMVKMAEDLGFGKFAGVAEFKQELESAKTKAECDAIYEKHKGALKREPTQQDWEAMINSKKSSLPAADDGAVVAASLETLSKVADALDKKGLEVFADYVDEVIKKIAARVPGGYEGGLGTQTSPVSPTNIDKLEKLAKLLKEKFGLDTPSPITAENINMALGEAYKNINVKRYLRPLDLDEPFLEAKKEFNSVIGTKNYNQIGALADHFYSMLTQKEKDAPVQKVQTGKGYAGNGLIKKVQKMLGVKTDGIWGPKTAAAWNNYMKTLDETWAKMGVNPNGKQAPSPEAMNSVLMGAGKRQEKAVKPDVTTPTEYGDKTMPWPGDATKKPAQEVDAENPDETARQRELRQQLSKMPGKLPRL